MNDRSAFQVAPGIVPGNELMAECSGRLGLRLSLFHIAIALGFNGHDWLNIQNAQVSGPDAPIDPD